MGPKLSEEERRVLKAEKRRRNKAARRQREKDKRATGPVDTTAASSDDAEEEAAAEDTADPTGPTANQGNPKAFNPKTQKSQTTRPSPLRCLNRKRPTGNL